MCNITNSIISKKKRRYKKLFKYNIKSSSWLYLCLSILSKHYKVITTKIGFIKLLNFLHNKVLCIIC